MIYLICLLWVGVTLNAPVWFYILLGLAFICGCFSTGVKIGKSTSDNGKDE